MAEAEARAAAQEAAKRQAAEEKAKAEAARQMAEAEARAAAQEAAKRQAAEEKAKAEAARQKAEAEAKVLLPPPNATAPPPSPVFVVPAATPQPSPVVAAPVVPTAPLSAVPTPRQSELSPSEIVEVQTRLEALGMKPGPLDGNLGSRTIGAIKRYEEANGLPQTGNIDREILGRLRQEKPISQAESASRKAAAPSAAAGADQMYNDAFKKLQEGDYAGAERGFKAFLQSNPKHVLAGNAQYWLGDTYYARRDYQNAMTAFAEGNKVYKASPKGPDNLLKLGVTLAVIGRKPDACAVFAKFNQDYPRATDLQKRRVEQERQKNGCG
jgi:tol-pal system protein YbgF